MSKEELKKELLDDYMVHDERCSYSTSDNPCDCIQKNVADNIMSLIVKYGNSRELEGLGEARKWSTKAEAVYQVEQQLTDRINWLESQKEKTQ